MVDIINHFFYFFFLNNNKTVQLCQPDPKNPQKIWIMARYLNESPVAVFIYDREDMDIIAGPEHPFKIIEREVDPEDYPAIKLLETDKLYDPNYLHRNVIDWDVPIMGHIQKTYPGKALITASLDDTLLGAPPPRKMEARWRLSLCPGESTDTLLLMLDENLHIKRYAWRLKANGKEWVAGTTDIVDDLIYGWDTDIMFHGLFYSMDIEDYQKKDQHEKYNWFGFVQLDLDLRSQRVFKRYPADEKFAEEFGYTGKFLDVGGTGDEITYSPDRHEILLAIPIEDRIKREEWVHIVRTDWNGERLKEIIRID